MKKILYALLISSILLGSWQSLIMLADFPNYILPSPWQVVLAFYQNYPLIVHHAIFTINEILIGLTGGICLGYGIGFLMIYFDKFGKYIFPLLIISQATPTFAIAPLLVIWFGYGLTSKVMTSILMIFFPVANTFYDGLKRTPPSWLDLAQVMQANKWRTFWTIQLPAALPTISSGIRIAVGIAPISAIVGEWVGASQGLGYLMINANAHMQIDMMFATLLVIILLALLMYFSVDKLLNYLIWW